MASSYVVYTGNGATTQFSVPFPYLRREHVFASLDRVNTTDFTWVNNNTIQFNSAPNNGVRVEIRRITPVNAPLVDFTDGSTLVAADLDTNYLQQTYINQEQDDQFKDAIFTNAQGLLDAGGKRLTNLADPTGAQDAATKNYTDTQDSLRLKRDGTQAMTGALNAGGFKVQNIAEPTANSDAASKNYVDAGDALKVSKAGDTMAGPLAMSGQKITGMGAPTASTDGATKGYVDAWFNSNGGVYFGGLASDPATDPLGNPVVVGDSYFNSVTKRLKVYDGAVWVDTAIPGSLVRWTKTAAGGETSLSGNDDNANPLNYTAGSEQIFLNGALLTRGVDYQATTGSTITGLVALGAGDVVDVLSLNQYVYGTVPDGSVTNSKVANGAAIASSKLAFTQAGTGAVQRTVDSKLKDVVSVKDFGAVGDGVADDTTAVANADDYFPYYAPQGVYSTTTATKAGLVGRKIGEGKIKTQDGNFSAPYFSQISSAPSSLGDHSSIETAFNGDISRIQFAVEHRITGASTLGQPAAGYLYTPEALPHYTYLYNSSGWNQSTSGNSGRTGAAAYRAKIFQDGQGDLVCFNGSAFVTGTRAGSTSFLANPAAVLFNGDMTAGADGVYLNPYETICTDAGYDVACVGIVNNFVRSISTGAKGAYWIGYRAQNTGSASMDNLVSATGKFLVGLDLSMSILDFGTNKAAVSLKADDRIYFNNASQASGSLIANIRTTVFNGDYITYSSSLGGFNVVRGGSSKLQITSNTVTVANASFQVDPSGAGGTGIAIVRGRQGGFGLPTGTVNTGAFDTSTVTLTQLAQYVAGLVQRIHASTSGAHALIGT